jgi:hypothetical protein
VSRAHCLDCGDHVVIDPTGRCPSGHEVGVPGARIEGALGSGTPHPDEPEPWVARVELDVEPSPPPAATPAREIRPPAAPPAPPAAAVVPSSVTPTQPARSDDLLRELHSLGDLDGHSTPPTASPFHLEREAAAAAPPPPAEPPTSPPVWTAPATAPDVSTAPAADSRSAFEELTALEAAVHALTGANATPRPSSNGVDDTNGHHNSNGHRVTAPSISDQLDDLFAAADAQATASPPAPPTPAPAPVATSNRPAALDVRERWSVLADVAELAESAPMPPAAPVPQVAPPSAVPPPAPSLPPAARAPAPAPAVDPGIDLGNFTASGKRVGEGRGKRRLFGR